MFLCNKEIFIVMNVMKIIKKFIKNEDGQTLGLLGLAALGLIVAVMFVYNIGDYFILRIREQNAVDAAAISGAAVQSEALNNIVRYQRNLKDSYDFFINTCDACCTACTPAGGCCCSVCIGTTPAMKAVEMMYKIYLKVIIIQARISFISETQDSYRKSGGTGFLMSSSFDMGDLKIVEVNRFLPKSRFPANTFCGYAEAKHNGRYDWAGGNTQYPEVRGSYNGYYDKNGPVSQFEARVNFKPITSWFTRSKSFTVKATARPYGGNLHTIMYRGGAFGKGQADFTAKLVPYGK